MCNNCIDKENINRNLYCQCSVCFQANADSDGEFSCSSCGHSGNIYREDIRAEMTDSYIYKENHDSWVRANDKDGF
jgi:hypothetical protein